MAQAMTLPKLKKKVQTKFNAWIRERDRGKPCIACGKHSDNMHASHFWPMGSYGCLRYNKDNVNSCCAACNLFKRGNLNEYRIGLIKKIGEERVQWLEDNRQVLKKWTRPELEEILKSLKL